MPGRKFIVWMGALAALLLGSGAWVGQAVAMDSAAEAKPAEQAEAGEQQTAPRPKSPIKISTIDFQDGEAGSKGKLKLAGIALPGAPLFIFFDESPYARVVADGEGKWSVEGDLELDDAPHTIRAEQYDKETKLLAGRAMVSIGRAKGVPPAQTPGQQNAP